MQYIYTGREFECQWLSGCRSSVAEYWLLKPGVLGLIPMTAVFSLSSTYFHLIISFYHLEGCDHLEVYPNVLKMVWFSEV